MLTTGIRILGKMTKLQILNSCSKEFITFLYVYTFQTLSELFLKDSDVKC